VEFKNQNLLCPFLRFVYNTGPFPFLRMFTPGPDVYLELMMLGTIFSAVAYGIVVVLSGNCFLLLQRKRGIYSNRMRLFLLIYVLVMFLFSTSSMIQSICAITLLIFRGGVGSLILTGYAAPVMVPLTIWGADGFMVSNFFLRQSEGLNSITDMALFRLVSGHH